MRAHTARRSISGSTGVSPTRAAPRIACAVRAEAIRALLGTQPVHRQSPPTRPRSTAATFNPRRAAKPAATMPASPGR